MRCCAKCKTPYNCGNALCRCHPAPEALSWENRKAAQAKAASLAADLTHIGGPAPTGPPRLTPRLP